MCKLPFNSAVGSDGISAEHICFADSTVALYLSLFFNMCILHGYIAKPCINTVIVPTVKNKNGNHQIVVFIDLWQLQQLFQSCLSKSF